MRSVLVSGLWILSMVLQAGTVAPPPPIVPPSPGGERGMIEDVLKQLMESTPVEGATEVRTIPVGRAALCPICQQPLYKHADPNWEGCVPLDLDGQPKRMLRIASVRAQDPVSGATFVAALPGNVNARGGIDTDFCMHSVGKWAVHARVWVHPDSGYAAVVPASEPERRFQLGLDGKPLPDDLKAFVRAELTPLMEQRMKRVLGLKESEPVPARLKPFSEYVQQTQIPDWIKYDHALRIYEKIRPPQVFMTRMYLEAAHACRREICSEVGAPALEEELQNSLTKALKRVQNYMVAETLKIRRDRGEQLMDPTRMETDPEILAEAAAFIIKAGRELTERLQTTPRPTGAPQRNFFTVAEMYLLHVVLAGAYDRLGRYEDADRTFDAALKYVPEKLPFDIQDPKLLERVTLQLSVLRAIVQDRKECLRLERDWIFAAARANMSSIKRGDVKFQNYSTGFRADLAAKDADPAPTAYQLGELLRRTGADDAAAVWFDTAGVLIDKALANVDAAEKANPPPPQRVVVTPGTPEPENAYERERRNLVKLKGLNQKQRALIKNPKPAPAEVTEVVVIFCKAAGIEPPKAQAASAQPEPGTAAPGKPATPEKVPAAAPDKPALPVETADGAVKPATRDELYRRYYSAIQEYRRANKANPAKLDELVKGNFISQAASCLNDKGALFCPETGQRLYYLRAWEPGDASKEVITAAGTRTLYADGSIRGDLPQRK